MTMLCGLLVLAVRADDSAQSDPLARRTAPALLAAVETNREYCRQCNVGQDFKSLARGAGGLTVLAELVRSQSDDEAWQTATAKLLAAARATEAAAKKADASAARTSLQQIRDDITALSQLQPSGKPLPLAKPSGGLRNLMYVLEATFADAKVSLAVDDAESAKNSAIVLSELGRLVFNERTDARWQRWSNNYLAAAREAASSDATQAAKLRPLFHAISQRCDSCHDKK